MTVREVLAQQNPDALLYDERYDAALAGWTVGFRAKGDTRPVAVYDRGKLVEILAAEFAAAAESDPEDYDEPDFELEAEEWIDYNMAYAHYGANAPVLAMSQRPTAAPESALVVLRKELEHSPSKSSSAAGHDHEGKSNCLIPDCRRTGIHRAPGGSLDQTLCCRHFEEFVEHVVDPETNPVFPRVIG